MEVEGIAQIVHEANRVYCRSIGDNRQPNWENAPAWQKESAINGVEFHLENPEASCSASHENWLKEKYADGWKYGETKDLGKKEHPCCVPYDELPVSQRVKDALFAGIVRALKILL